MSLLLSLPVNSTLDIILVTYWATLLEWYQIIQIIQHILIFNNAPEQRAKINSIQASKVGLETKTNTRNLEPGKLEIPSSDLVQNFER